MAAINAVHTLAAVANMLDVSEEFLYDLSIEMEPEDGCIAFYGTGDDYIPGFTADGIERLRELIAEPSNSISPSTRRDRCPRRMLTDARKSSALMDLAIAGKQMYCDTSRAPKSEPTGQGGYSVR